MSFSYNPLVHIEVVEDDVELWSVYCHGCGAVLKGHGPDEPLATFVANMAAHVHSSHGRDAVDFQTWSKF